MPVCVLRLVLRSSGGVERAVTGLLGFLAARGKYSLTLLTYESPAESPFYRIPRGVMPCFNGERCLSDALEIVLTQATGDFGLLVVDDCTSWIS